MGQDGLSVEIHDGQARPPPPDLKFMEFKSLALSETGFRQIRLFTLVFLALCATVTLCAVWMSYRYAEAQREKIYVLDQGKSLMLALSQDLRQNRPVEAREHVRHFHELLHLRSKSRRSKATSTAPHPLMADRSAMSYYKVLMEKGYFNRHRQEAFSTTQVTAW